MKRAGPIVALALLAACSGGANSTAPVGPAGTNPPTTPPPPATTMVAAATTSTSTTAPPQPSTTTTTTSAPSPTPVTTSGTYADAYLEIRLGFRSEVADVTTGDLTAAALEILNDPAGWPAAGFTFVLDTASELTVVLAEGARVDELCMPLDTGGIVNCQNGPIVALNADRWRAAFDGWDSTLAAYRTYVVNHEVGHLIGLRHPEQRCPTAEMVSAVMEPQTTNLQGCTGNGVPMGWEVDWARNRPAVVAPDPAWDGPRPVWPGSKESG